MKMIVFGATGLLGSRLVEEALRRGHEVTAAARHPSRMSGGGGDVRVVPIDVTQADTVAEVAQGHDLALTAVTQHDRPEVLVEAAHGLLAGLPRAAVPRLVVAGGAGSLKVASGQRLMDTPDFHEQWKPEARAQARALAVYEQAGAEVDWVYVSPAALLEPGERTGKYRVGADQLIVDEQGRSRITMEDFAIAMLDEAEQSSHSRERFTAGH
jgi:putative NADH-flavin reductase